MGVENKFSIEGMETNGIEYNTEKIPGLMLNLIQTFRLINIPLYINYIVTITGRSYHAHNKEHS